jgi:hypothetical protein
MVRCPLIWIELPEMSGMRVRADDLIAVSAPIGAVAYSGFPDSGF